MRRPPVERKGPVLLLSRSRARRLRLRALIEADGFSAWEAESDAELRVLEPAHVPTVIVLDWSAADDPPLHDLIHRFRPGRAGPRIVVIADGAEAEALANTLAVRGVIGRRLDPEEVADVVWRAHQEAIDARSRA